jgi:cobalt/nickel transport system permease protein
MTLAFHAPGSVDGWLRRLDARWKIAAFTVAIVGAACASQMGGAFVVAAFALALARAGGVSGGRLFMRVASVAGLLVLFFIWDVFRPRPGEMTWLFYGWPVSRLGFVALFVLVGKTVAIVAFLFTLLETTPLPELGRGAAGLGVPRLFVHLVLLTQRYVFVLAEEFSRLRRALRVRGYRSRANRRGFATIGAVAGTLVVRGHERAERVYHAMAARGFDGVFRSLAAARSAPIDIAFFAGMAIATAVFVGWDRGWLPS